MKNNIISSLIINVKLFCISILVLFFIAIQLGLASHNANANILFLIYFIIVGIHILCSIIISRRKGISIKSTIYISSCVLLLYFILAYCYL